MRCSPVRMFAFKRIRTSWKWISVKIPARVLVIGLLFICVNSLEVNIGFIVSKSQVGYLEETDIIKIVGDTKSLYNETILQSATINASVFSFASNEEILDKTSSIINNKDIDIVVSLAPYTFSNMFGIYASTFMKPLVIANNFYDYNCDSYLVSMQASFLSIAQGLTGYLTQFKWGTLVFLTSTDDNYWQQMIMSVENHLLKSGFAIRNSMVIDNVYDHTIVLKQLQEISNAEKAVILAMDASDAVEVINAASSWDSLQKHTLILIVKDLYTNFTSLIRGGANYTRVLQSVFILSPTVPNVAYPDVTETSSLLIQSVIQDSLVTIFQGYHRLENSSDVTKNGKSLVQMMRGYVSENLGRVIAFNSACTRYVHFSLYDYDITKADFSLVRYIWPGCVNSWCYKNIKDISWPDGIVVEPDECFLSGDCSKPSGVNIVLAVSIPLSLITLGGIVAIVLILLWKRKTKRLMTKGPNKILLEQEDLVFLHRKDIKSSKITNGGFLDTPDLLKASEKSNRSMVSLHEWTEFSEIARYKGDIVYLKELKYKGVEMKGNILAYTRMLRDVRHENVNPLYGYLNDPIRPALVSEYCNRGSLEDVLRNENIKLDWDFKVSLLTDLVRGLRYIQGSHIRYHGSLSSKNCVIDSRWVLKLTDFGMARFREKAKMIVKFEPHELLWTAPEHLRDPVPASKGSEKGDMYALSIIMQEVILRKRPFAMIDLTTEELLHKLRHPPPLLRPSVSPQAAQPQYIQLMKECWSENPELRPNIEEVYQQFKAIQGGKKMNIVDSMFRMLEKYSNDLEDLVKERTTQLEEEKKKTDVLLYRMLPHTVAESLKAGRRIDAESFELVTIYFSDIVGFTTISALSTPMQVVDLLNDLYTMFDATIDTYDVYKVETIGDAYMVVSGLPVRNETHPGEIATMALDLLSGCGSFTIRHMPEVPLRLRIGVHTGSCVAGVVGLTMPRYCLFGDTVNTASRMESSGSAFRVHVSETTKCKLDEMGGYKMEYRGQIELKGKGMANTFWLVGKEGFQKPLPEPPSLTELDSLLKERKISSISNVSSLNGTPQTVKRADEKLLSDHVCLQDMRCACCDSPKLDSKMSHDKGNCDEKLNQSAKSTKHCKQAKCVTEPGGTEKKSQSAASVCAQTCIVVTDIEPHGKTAPSNQNAQNKKTESNNPKLSQKENNISPLKRSNSPLQHIGGLHANSSNICGKEKAQSIQMSTFQTKEKAHVHRTHSPDKIQVNCDIRVSGDNVKQDKFDGNLPVADV